MTEWVYCHFYWNHTWLRILNNNTMYVLGDDTRAGQNYWVWSVYAKSFFLFDDYDKTNQPLMCAQACHLVKKHNLWILFLEQSNGKRRIFNVERNGWSLDIRSLTEFYSLWSLIESVYPLFPIICGSSDLFFSHFTTALPRYFIKRDSHNKGFSNVRRSQAAVIEIPFQFRLLISCIWVR